MAGLWAAQLRTGSFRGVQFGIAENRDSEHGRRGALHEFPEQDTPYFQDLGRKARTYTIEAVIYGTNYTTRRDQLISACEKSGSGVLIHPDFGLLRVNVTSMSVRHSKDDGGIVRVSLGFVESGDSLLAGFGGSKFAAVATKVSEGITEAKSAFDDAWAVTGYAQATVDAAEGLVSNFATFAASLTGPASPTGLAAQIAGIGDSVSTIVDSGDEITTQYDNLGAMFGTADAPADPKEAQRLVDMFAYYGTNDGTDDELNDFGVPVTKTIDQSTPDGVQEAANQAAHYQYIWEYIALTAIDMATNMTFESYDQATELRASIVSLLDRARGSVLGVDMYDKLQELRLSVFDTIPPDDADLPNQITKTLNRTEPALTLAWELYGDANRADEIAARNNVENPLFLPADVALNVLDA